MLKGIVSAALEALQKFLKNLVRSSGASHTSSSRGVCHLSRAQSFVQLVTEELTVFAMPIPVFDLGPGVDLGLQR